MSLTEIEPSSMDKLSSVESPERNSFSKDNLKSFQYENNPMIYTDERPYVCCQCQLRFSGSFNFKCHLQKCYLSNRQPMINRDSRVKHFSGVKYKKKPSRPIYIEALRFICSLCDQILLSAYSLRRHLAWHRAPAPYACTECDNRFRNHQHLIDHVTRTHFGNQLYACTGCEKSFVSEKGLKMHTTRMHPTGGVIKKMKANGLLSRVLSPEKDRPGIVSNNNSSTPANVKEPISFKKRSIPVNIKVIAARTIIPAKRRLHDTRTNSTDIVLNATNNSSSSGNVEEMASRRIIPAKRRLKNTANDIDGNALQAMNRTSSTANSTNVDKIARDRAKRIVKGDKAKFQCNAVRITDSERPYVCYQCKLRFVDSLHLLGHIHEYHLGSRQFTCNVCDRSFKRKNYLYLHICTHIKSLSYSCTVCGKCFRFENHLKKHSLTHRPTVKKKFDCNECEKTFSNQARLNWHIGAWHTDVKKKTADDCVLSGIPRTPVNRTPVAKNESKRPFVCFQCELTFTDSHHLIGHIYQYHLGYRRFICNICDKPFSNARSLHTHVLVHINVLPYLCADCGLSFRFKRYLTKHQRSHTLEVYFDCNECGKQFAYQYRLAIHLARVHPGVPKKLVPLTVEKPVILPKIKTKKSSVPRKLILAEDLSTESGGSMVTLNENIKKSPGVILTSRKRVNRKIEVQTPSIKQANKKSEGQTPSTKQAKKKSEGQTPLCDVSQSLKKGRTPLSNRRAQSCKNSSRHPRDRTGPRSEQGHKSSSSVSKNRVDDLKYKCTDCDAQFRTKNEYTRHRKMSHHTSVVHNAPPFSLPESVAEPPLPLVRVRGTLITSTSITHKVLLTDFPKNEIMEFIYDDDDDVDDNQNEINQNVRCTFISAATLES